MDWSKRAAAVLTALAASALLLTGAAFQGGADVELTITGKDRAFDGNVTTWVPADRLFIDAASPVDSIALDWLEAPGGFELYAKTASGWRLAYRSAAGMVRYGIRLKWPVRELRLEAPGAKLSELAAYTPGRAPADFQEWELPPDKADMMVIAAHPDDELLYMGGTLPYYAGEMEKTVVVVYMTHQKRVRQSEALDGLWECGQRYYPVFMGYPDKKTAEIDAAARLWGGKTAVSEALAALYTRYRPDVVISHDTEGEYGHGAHMLTAICALDAAAIAAAPELRRDVNFDEWEISKLYLHLYKENKIKMDWRKPLRAFGGDTALEVARRAFKKHKTQQYFGFSVDDAGEARCAEFGLAYTSVGLDRVKDDFFENINEDAISNADRSEAASKNGPANAVGLAAGICAFGSGGSTARRRRAKSAAFVCALCAALALSGCSGGENGPTEALAVLVEAPKATPTPTPVPTPTPTPVPTPTPDPFEEYFLPAGEERFSVDEDRAHWEYSSHALNVTVDKIRDEKGKHTYYVADIRQRDGERERGGFGSGQYRGKREFPYRIARRYGAVFAINGDFLDTIENNRKGILIRDGEIYSENDGEDSLVFWPDGTMTVLGKEDMGEGVAQALLDRGVMNVFSFGPVLVQDGQVNPEVAEHRLKQSNPRCGIGMVEPNHFIAIVSDGRKKSVIGMKLVDFANLFVEYGCAIAYNLDGGASANMVLMGQSVMESTAEAGRRPAMDVLMFGESELVPGMDEKVPSTGAMTLTNETNGLELQQPDAGRFSQPVGE